MSSLFYGVDQIGSVRPVFASPTSAPAYSLDPYGVPLQTTAPLADFDYAGLFSEPDNGLSLATYRAYDPRVGRWISRDPIGERRDQAGNLYAYVSGNPVSMTDPKGLDLVSVSYPRLSRPPPQLHKEGYTQAPSNSLPQACVRDCYAECAHLLPSPSGDLQRSEFRRCYKACKGESVMMEKADAILIKNGALSAIIELSKLLKHAEGNCSEADLSQIKRAVGLSIGEIQVGILDLVSAIYPELDDLA